MHRDDLKAVWTCAQCGSRFVFNSDVVDHVDQTGHDELQKYDISSGRLVDIIRNWG